MELAFDLAQCTGNTALIALLHFTFQAALLVVIALRVVEDTGSNRWCLPLFTIWFFIC